MGPARPPGMAALLTSAFATLPAPILLQEDETCPVLGDVLLLLVEAAPAPGIL